MQLVQVELSDDVYDQITRKATEAGFGSLGEYLADMITEDAGQDASEEEEDFQHLFTPERLAHIDRVVAAMDAGEKTYSMEEVEEYLAETREKWIKEHRP